MFLPERVIRRVVTASTLELDSQERRSQHMSLGRHGNVVLSGHRETGWTSSVATALHQDQFRHEPVDRLVVPE